MAGSLPGVLKNSILLGQVVPSNLKNALKVQVPYFTFDERLKAYFKKTEDFIAVDPSKESKTGDVVIIQKLEKQTKKDITHHVSQTVFKLGDVKDPISGEYVVGSEYRNRRDKIDELYGATGNFKYDEAPKRGRLEGTRDFTDKPTYRTWHEFEKDDPYGIRN
eukprot:TRINITY_DN27201_c0_g1_i1.p1 TRINITY_DN27201_c0_g1~~TRINITY_DN27201_c0_g1_i1.p1  ORF type:complete len:163 (-),score=37.58 TRINITY_DN27201_c0_g1_i1:131-619(-)